MRLGFFSVAGLIIALPVSTDPQPRELFFLGSAETASPLAPLPIFPLPAAQLAPAYANSSIFLVPHAGISLDSWPFVGIKITAADFKPASTSGFAFDKVLTLWNVVPGASGSVQFADIHGTMCLEFSESDFITSEWFKAFTHKKNDALLNGRSNQTSKLLSFLWQSMKALFVASYRRLARMLPSSSFTSTLYLPAQAGSQSWIRGSSKPQSRTSIWTIFRSSPLPIERCVSGCKESSHRASVAFMCLSAHVLRRTVRTPVRVYGLELFFF
jgi:hypothetical protein